MKGTKIIWLILLTAVFVICGCNKILLPSGDITQVEIVNVMITFDFESQMISADNGNYSDVYLEISRWNDDVQKYLLIWKERIKGYGEKSNHAEFDHGNEIKIFLKIIEGEGEEIVEYYTLG